MVEKEVAPERHDVVKTVARWAPVAFLVLALTIGAWVRFHDLTRSNLYGDEAEYAIVARSIHDDFLNPSWNLGERVVNFVSQPPLVMYLTAISLAVFTDATFAVRFVPASLGVLGIIAVYLLGREVRGPWTGAIAAGILAVTPLHITVSRVGFLDAPLATFATFAAWMFLRAIRTRRLVDAALAGFLAVATALAKLPGVIVIVAFIIFLAVQALRERVRDGSWAAAAKAEGTSVTAALMAEKGRVVLAGLSAALALGVAYLILIATNGSWQNWTSKLSWQFGRVTGSREAAKPWNYYLEGPLNFPHFIGEGTFVLALAGFVVAVVIWFLPTRFGGGRPGPALMSILAATVSIFFIASARKVWFYTTPAVPFFALLAAFAVTWTIGVVSRDWIGERVPTWRKTYAPYARPLSVLAVVALVGTQAMAPTFADALEYTRDSSYGAGYSSPCAYVRDSQTSPEEGVLTSVLGRYAFRFYCPDVMVYDRFREVETGNMLVTTGKIRYLITDPFHQDGSDKRFFDRLLSIFPHDTVAKFGRIEVIEFRPVNLTVDVKPSALEYWRGADKPIPHFTVTITNRVGPATVPNPAGALVHNLSGRVANITVEKFSPEGWPYTVYWQDVTLGNDWRILPSHSKSFEFDWAYSAFWSKKGDGVHGPFTVTVRVAGEAGVTSKFMVHAK